MAMTPRRAVIFAAILALVVAFDQGSKVWARTLPVDGVVVENGGLFVLRGPGGKLRKVYAESPRVRESNRTRLVAEVTELTEKVDNALQVTEDVYLARIYASALDLFRVPTVGAAVDRKLAIIRDTYTALYQEASAARAALMEAVIVVLIAVEIVLALLRH